MKIEFVSSVEDQVAFRVHYASITPEYKRSRTSAAILGFFVVLSLAVGVGGLFQSWIPLAIGLVAAIVAAARVFLGPLVNKDQLRQILARDAHDAFGPCSAYIDSDQITATWPLGSMSTHWRAISEIADTTDYAFIYTSRGNAVILPKRSITQGDFEQFLSQAREYCRNAKDQNGGTAAAGC